MPLEWLDETPRRSGDLPGVWWQDADAAYLDPAGAGLGYHGAPVTEVTRFELVNSGDGTRVLAGGVEIEVARRFGYLIRVHDPKATARVEFHGVPSYEPDRDWVLTGEFEPFDQPKPTEVGAVAEGLGHVYVAPGIVRFRHAGIEYTLTAFNGKKSGLEVLFSDETSGVTTYAAARGLLLPEPDEDGTVILDFNRAINLPCGFTDFATCPVPPAGNHLPFAVTAGEQIPYERWN